MSINGDYSSPGNLLIMDSVLIQYTMGRWVSVHRKSQYVHLEEFKRNANSNFVRMTPELFQEIPLSSRVSITKVFTKVCQAITDGYKDEVFHIRWKMSHAVGAMITLADGDYQFFWVDRPYCIVLRFPNLVSFPLGHTHNSGSLTLTTP